MKYRENVDRSRIALFSDCDRFRYELLIRWNPDKPLVANCGLNPSTADEFKNDPTVHRDIKRADDLGYGSLLKVNLFAYRSPSPKEMMSAPDPYGDWVSTQSLLDSIQKHDAQMVIAAWGNHGSHMGRSSQFRSACIGRGIRLYKYEINRTGEPVHPLYKPYSLEPTPYEFAAGL